MKTYKIVCYGLGQCFDRFIEKANQEVMEIIAVVDRNIDEIKKTDTKIKWKGEGGILALRHPRDIVSLDYDFVLICSDLYKNEMLSLLLEVGIPGEKTAFVGGLPYAPPKENYFRWINSFFAAVNRDNAIVSQLQISDESSYFMVNGIRNSGRSHRLDRFPEKANKDYV